jgi:hypothetical protein
MSVRGLLVVECDVPHCHAEEHVSALSLQHTSFHTIALRSGWVYDADRDAWTCPQCGEEGKTA